LFFFFERRLLLLNTYELSVNGESWHENPLRKFNGGQSARNISELFNKKNTSDINDIITSLPALNVALWQSNIFKRILILIIEPIRRASPVINSSI